jgi:hypothetical protein
VQRGGRLNRGYLLLDDVLIQRYRSGKLGLRKARDTSTGAWVLGLSLVVLAWTDGKRRIPLAFLPYFGEESELDLALALLAWAKEAGFRPEGVLFDAWYAARRVLEWLHAHGRPFVTRLRSNRVRRSTGCGKRWKRFSGGFNRNWGGRGIGTGVGPGCWPIWPWGWWPMGSSSVSESG